jgi:hypothetical protein
MEPRHPAEPAVRAVLRAAGLSADHVPAEALLECARIARDLRVWEVRALGILPADDGVAVPAVALAIARALAVQGTRPVGVLDAGGTWPCAAALRALRPASATPEEDPGPAWAEENLAVLLGPPAADGALAAIRATVGARRYEHLVVDLTGAGRRGEHLEACGALDGLVVLARLGRSRVRPIVRALGALPAGAALGVLLTGA